MSALTTAQHDRAAGVLLGQACGDALGVPYEFGRPPGADELAEMKGGGLGPFAPGEWSDDTAMAVAVAEGLRNDGWLDEIAAGFLRWYDGRPPDIGNQTRAVLAATSRRTNPRPGAQAAEMSAHAVTYGLRHPHSAGNGALMRTSPVALAFLDDRDACAEAARRVAGLTHGDPLAGDSCVLWSEAIRVAVLEGRLDVRRGLDLLPESRHDQWAAWIDAALTDPPGSFTPNGFTVTALQAAIAAIAQTPGRAAVQAARRFRCLHLQDALHAAVRIGDDTDTVAAIAGGLLGAYWGASAVPWRWRRAVHGWPGSTARDLTSLAAMLDRDPVGDHDWPACPDVVYRERASDVVVPHPHDAGVLLGTHRSRRHGATAVVSLCRVGRQQACFDGAEVVIESRLIDSDELAKNPNLHFALYDAADAVRGLRAEGHTVLLHCVAAQQRTPSVAVAYSILLGHSPAEAQRAVLSALPAARGHGALWDAAAELGGAPDGR